MASTSATSPGTLADDSAVGSAIWSNPSNASGSDNSYATIANVPGGVQSHYLKATNFGFSIPASATIEGVVVEIERKRDGGTVQTLDNTVKLVKAGSVVGDNLANTASNWPTTDTYASYGSSSTLWGTTWTESEINASNFGMVLSIDADTGGSGPLSYVDHIRVTIYYLEPTTTSTSSSTSTSSTSTSTSLSTSTSSTSLSTSTSSTSTSQSTSSTSSSTSMSTSSTSTSMSTSTSTSVSTSTSMSTSSTSTSVSTSSSTSSTSQSTSTTQSFTTSTSSTSSSTSSTTTLMPEYFIPRIKPPFIYNGAKHDKPFMGVKN